MKFQGTAGAKKAPKTPSFAAVSAAPFWLRRATRVCAGSRRRNRLRGLAQGLPALSDPDHDVAHRLAGFDRFMRRHDGAEIEALRHVVEELAALEHARN